MVLVTCPRKADIVCSHDFHEEHKYGDLCIQLATISGGLLLEVYFFVLLDEEPIALVRCRPRGAHVRTLSETMWHGAPTTVSVARPAHGSHIAATQDGDVHQNPI